MERSFIFHQDWIDGDPSQEIQGLMTQEKCGFNKRKRLFEAATVVVSVIGHISGFPPNNAFR